MNIRVKKNNFSYWDTLNPDNQIRLARGHEDRKHLHPLWRGGHDDLVGSWSTRRLIPVLPSSSLKISSIGSSIMQECTSVANAVYRCCCRALSSSWSWFSRWASLSSLFSSSNVGSWSVRRCSWRTLCPWFVLVGELAGSSLPVS